MAIEIDADAANAKSRLVLVALSTLTLRLMEKWWQLMVHLTARAPDYESIMILGAVFSINSERLLRSDIDPLLQDLNVPLPSSFLSKSNISSVAAATGLNRETARRRIKDLVSQGVLIREGGGLRLAHGLMQHPEVQGATRAQLETFRMAATQLERLAVLKDSEELGRSTP